jgi:hypothetical protein
MANNDEQQITFGMGASGLAPPSIVYGNLNLQPIITALQRRQLNQQRMRALDLELQKLSQTERLQREEHQIQMRGQDLMNDYRMQELGQLGPLRDAEAKHYDQLTKASIEKATHDTEDLGSWQNDMKDVTAPIGSAEWQTQALAVYNNHLDAMATTAGQRAWRGLFNQHKNAAAQAWTGLRASTGDYKQALQLNGLTDYAFQNPGAWTDTEDKSGKKLLMGSDGKILLQTPDNLKKANQIDPVTQQPLASFKTLPKATFDNFMQSHKNYSTISSGIGLPAVNPFTGQPYGDPAPTAPQGQRPLDKATAASILQEVGGDPDAARELAKKRGYTF